MPGPVSYNLSGDLLGGCSCDWGCPCNFEAAPTQGWCEGGYVWHVREGFYGAARLDGLNFAWFTHSPGPLHLGNATSIYFVDQRADAHQRQALEEMLTRDPDVIPFSVFSSLTSNLLGVRSVPFEVAVDGVHSRVKVPGTLDLGLEPMKNPVTGEDEPATLLKPKGFTSQSQELCSTSTLRLTTAELSYDHGGKYGEFCTFEYKGP
ncbi:MAG: DUF1326 domain-containing protein [Dehalococcoidia bacterium]